jgi:hypothetical protein
MKTLLVGMQSSGASFVTFCLAQAPRTIAVVDLWCDFVAPPLIQESARFDIILKATITANIPLERHLQSLKPDRFILVTRNVDEIRQSLVRKPWRDSGGLLEVKLRIYEDILLRKVHWFDQVIAYERVARTPPPLHRSREDIRRFNCEHSVWCKEAFEKQWGFGAYREK